MLDAGLGQTVPGHQDQARVVRGVDHRVVGLGGVGLVFNLKTGEENKKNMDMDLLFRVKKIGLTFNVS